METTRFNTDVEAIPGAEAYFTEGTTTETATVAETPQPTIQPIPTITVSEVLRLLSEGYSRTTKEKAYNPSIGTIQDFFGLTDSQIKDVFRHEALKGKRTKAVRVNVPTVNIIDDTVQVESDENNN